MTKKARWMAAIAAVVLVLAAAGRASATVYRYIDDKGVQCYTDSIYKVPDRFRDKAVLLDDDGTVINRLTPENRASSSFVLTEEGPARRSEGFFAGADWVARCRRFFGSNGKARTAVFVAGFLFLFIAAGPASASLGHKQIGSVVRFALAAFLLLYLAGTYMKDIALLYTELREDVISAKKQTDERNAEIKKASNALFGEPEK